MHSFGGHILRLPFQDYENKKDLDVFFITRDSYERILRRLVRNSSKRIRWMTGTATGLKTVVDSSSVESSSIRLGNAIKRIGFLFHQLLVLAFLYLEATTEQGPSTYLSPCQGWRSTTSLWAGQRDIAVRLLPASVIHSLMIELAIPDGQLS